MTSGEKRQDTARICISRTRAERRPVERFGRFSRKMDRSVNDLVAEEILEYLDRQAETD
jgi:hypothetical protein